MCTFSLLLLSVLLTGLVCTVQGKCVEVDDGDQEPNEVEVRIAVAKLPGLCWACKWALNKVKKSAGNDASAEKLKTTLKSICDQIGLLKSLCRKFVNKYFDILIEELTTTDNVHDICVNIKACKAKELLEERSFQNLTEVFRGSYLEEE